MAPVESHDSATAAATPPSAPSLGAAVDGKAPVAAATALPAPSTPTPGFGLLFNPAKLPAELKVLGLFNANSEADAEATEASAQAAEALPGERSAADVARALKMAGLVIAALTRGAANNPALLQRLGKFPSMGDAVDRLLALYLTEDEQPRVTAEERAGLAGMQAPLEMMQLLNYYLPFTQLQKRCDKGDYDERTAALTKMVAALKGGREGFQVLHARDVDEMSKPAYYVAAREGPQKEVIIVIRGSKSNWDWITDLVADGAPFQLISGKPDSERGHHCHRGIARATVEIWDEIKGLLQQDKYKQYSRITVAGHSLGGGVTTLLTLLLHKQLPDIGLGHVELRGYAYEPPPVADIQLAKSEAALELVTSLVHEDDIVPRFSVRSVCGLLDRAAALPESNKYLSALRELPDLPSKALLGKLSALLGQAVEGAKKKDGKAAGLSPNVGLDGFNSNYNAHVPGRVVFAYHTQSPAEFPEGNCTGSHVGQLALLDCTHPQVTTIRAVRRYWKDHGVETLGLLAQSG